MKSAVRLAGVVLLSCAAASLAQSPMAADKDDTRGVIKTFESWDRAQMAARCAPDAMVVDDFGQHLWKGPKACSNWMDAVGAFMQAHNMAGASQKFDEPWQIAVDQQAAYVVLPQTFRFTVNGKAGALDGIWTWSLKKTDAGWKITSMTWTARACGDVELPGGLGTGFVKEFVTRISVEPACRIKERT